jgi:hypothetical protein
VTRPLNRQVVVVASGSVVILLIIVGLSGILGGSKSDIQFTVDQAANIHHGMNNGDVFGTLGKLAGDYRSDRSPQLQLGSRKKMAGVYQRFWISDDGYIAVTFDEHTHEVLYAGFVKLDKPPSLMERVRVWSLGLVQK